MLKSEVKSIGKLDMSKFGCDFKSKNLAYGAERLKTDKGYNLDIINRYDCGASGMPELPAIDCEPGDFMGFNYAKSTSSEDKKDKACHFFLDDYQFERLWNSPREYVDLLRQFAYVVAPDFSLYMDMPYPMQAWNRYRSQALAYFWLTQGITVIPLLTWSDEESYKFTFNGVPKGSTVATSTVGIQRDKNALKAFKSGLKAAIKAVQPTRLLHVGHMKNAAKRAKGEITAQQTHHHMPIDGRLTSRAGYTITHEYGHLVQHALYQRALKNGYNGTEEAFRQRAFVSIASSAVRKYGATGKDLSNYGRNNAAEFFAESFANANLGAPNAFGRAMQDYLKSNPLR